MNNNLICKTLFLFSMFTGTGLATQMPTDWVPMGFGTLTAQSDEVIIGRCTALESRWVDRRLVTVATISVDETLKGQKAPQISVVIPGGIDTGRKIPVAMIVDEAPRIVPDEAVLLFLRASSRIPGSYRVTGLSQGKFTIVRDTQGRKSISRVPVAAQAIETRAVAGGAEGASSGSTPLDRVRRIVTEGGNKP